MAIVVTELIDSRKYVNDHAKAWTLIRVYVVTGSNNISDAFVAGGAETQIGG